MSTQYIITIPLKKEFAPIEDWGEAVLHAVESAIKYKSKVHIEVDENGYYQDTLIIDVTSVGDKDED